MNLMASSSPACKRFTPWHPTLLTCDTGISANESIDYAQKHGIDVIVTDHHTLPRHSQKLMPSSTRRESILATP
jgi:RecJ-like exonuclease